MSGASNMPDILRSNSIRYERCLHRLVFINVGVLPSDQLTIGIEARLESTLNGWPIKVLLDVLRTRVNHLNGSTHLASNHSGLQRIVGIALPTKTTAHKVVVQRHLLNIQTEIGGQMLPETQRVLATDPNLRPVCRDLCCCVWRFHAGVRQVWHAIVSGQHSRRTIKGSSGIAQGNIIGSVYTCRNIPVELLKNRFA